MVKKNPKPNIFQRIVTFLRDPVWNGVTCLITALVVLIPLVGGIIIAFVLGLFNQLKNVFMWFSEPINISRYVIIIGLFILIASVLTIINQFFHSKGIKLLSLKSFKYIKTKYKFLPIPLIPGVGNSSLDECFITPPIGDVVLGKAQFTFKPDSLIFDTSKQKRYSVQRPDGGKEINLPLHRPENRLKSVYFLINSGNSKRIYLNERIGAIRLNFKEAPPIEVELILGHNIREWCPGNPGDFVRELTSPTITVDAWNGLSKSGALAVMDCMQVKVYECMRYCFLENIVFIYKPTHRPTDTLGVHFSVFAISLEMER